MSESDIQRICERLESLEKQNHKIKVVSILLFSVVLIGLLIWAIPNGAQKVQARQTMDTGEKEPIRSEGFVLVDWDGNCRARLAMEAGAPSLTFLNVEGKVVCRLVEGDRPGKRPQPEESVPSVQSNGLYLYDAAGLPGTSVQFQNGFNMHDKTGQLKVSMNSSGLRLIDGEKKAYMNSLGMRLFDGEQKIISLQSNNGLTLFNSDGKECANLMATHGLFLWDPKGTARVDLVPWKGLSLYGSDRSGLNMLSVRSYNNDDKDKRCLLSLDGNKGLILYDAEGKPKMNLDSSKAEDQ